MSNIPRKILFVKRVPPANGYVAMIEVDDRTLSLQITDAAGEELMSRIQDIIVDTGVKAGWVTPSPIQQVPTKKIRRHQ